MTDSQEKVQIEVDSGIVENGSSNNDLDDANSPEYKRLTRRVLWKLDIHVLPALALVCPLIYFNYSIGLIILFW